MQVIRRILEAQVTGRSAKHLQVADGGGPWIFHAC
jgi:hypothetical protein